MKMDAVLKAQWVAALRSGKYEQVTGQLRKPHGFCCLGVLCDVAPAVEWNGGLAIFNRNDGPDASSDGAELPRGFGKSIGVEDDAETQLIGMNDGNKERGIRQHTFAEIADWIEANL